MSIRKIMVSLLAFYTVGAWGGVCPNLDRWDFPPFFYPKVEQVNIENEVIYFCRDYRFRHDSIDPPIFSDHFIVDITENDLIGEPTGVKAIGLGNYDSKDQWNKTKDHSIGQSSVILDGDSDTTNLFEGRNNPIIEQDIQLATKSISPWRDSSWIEYGFFHFYKKYPAWGEVSCNVNFYASFRRTLRENASIFKAGHGAAFSYEAAYPKTSSLDSLEPILGIIKAELKNKDGDTLDADLIVYWDQGRRAIKGGSPNQQQGGPVDGYCHFSVGVDIVINTRDPNFNIKKSGDYTISVGVATK